MSFPISSRLSSFRMSDAYLSDLHSRTSPVGASQLKLRKLGVFPNKPSKLSFARYKPLASDQVEQYFLANLGNTFVKKIIKTIYNFIVSFNQFTVTQKLFSKITFS